MPYIEKTGKEKIKEQLWQWDGVMHDPNIDGFNGWGCKQKIYEIYFYAKEMIENAPKYSGEDEWLEEKRLEQAERNYKDETRNNRQRLCGFCSCLWF